MDLVHGSFGLAAQIEQLLFGVGDVHGVVVVKFLSQFVRCARMAWRCVAWSVRGNGERSGALRASDQIMKNDTLSIVCGYCLIGESVHVCLHVYLPVCLHVYLPVCLPSCLSVCLSVCSRGRTKNPNLNAFRVAGGNTPRARKSKHLVVSY